jgi:hypothetical protein
MSFQLCADISARLEWPRCDRDVPHPQPRRRSPSREASENSANLFHLTTRDNPQRGRARARSEGARWSNLSKERKSAPDLRACRPIPLFPIRLPVGKLGCAHEGSTAFDDVRRTTLGVGLLERYADLDAPEEMRRALYDGRDWCASVLQSHASHPSLIYFRSVGTDTGWPAAAGTGLGAYLRASHRRSKEPGRRRPASR